MRLQVFFASAVAVTGCCAFAGDGVYRGWWDWGFRPVERTEGDPNADCRYYSDLSEPMHGPWLTNPTANGITVTWITRAVCGAAVDWREKGETEFRRTWIARQGAIDYLSKTHSLHLTGLKPATTYEYRVVTAMATHDYYSTEPFVARDVRSFTTMDPEAESCKAFFSSDVHGGFRLMLDAMIDRGHGDDAQLYFLLGDNVEDGMYQDAEYWMTFCFLDDCTRRFAKDRPLVAIRGNHDCWGREAGRWSEFMPRPDGRAYYTVRQGPVLFVMLDCFEEYRAKGAGREQAAAYRQEMAAWLKGLKTTDEWRTATYRVAMCHFGVVADFSVKWPRETFGEILRDESSDGRIHLFLCGHEHRHRRKLPHSADFATLRSGGRPWKSPAPKIDRKTKLPIPPKVWTNDFPFAEIELDSHDAVTIEATRTKLAFRAWDWRQPGETVGCYDAVDIAPDGTVTLPADAK